MGKIPIFSFSAEASEVSDMMLDQFVSEGDEDALVIQQFEDALIETVQNDAEMATFMNTYLEARRRLTEKTRSRGFLACQREGFRQKGKVQAGVPTPSETSGTAHSRIKLPHVRPTWPLEGRVPTPQCRQQHDQSVFQGPADQHHDRQ